MNRIDANQIDDFLIEESYFGSNKGNILCSLGHLLTQDYSTTMAKGHETEIGKENEDAPGLIISYNCNLRSEDFRIIKKGNVITEERNLEETLFLNAISPALNKDLGMIISTNKLKSSGVYFLTTMNYEDLDELTEKYTEFGFTEADSDPGAVYRTLKLLGSDGFIKAKWKTDEPGPAKKIYSITADGLKLLSSWTKEIKERKKTFELFLKRYNKLKSNK